MEREKERERERGAGDGEGEGERERERDREIEREREREGGEREREMEYIGAWGESVCAHDRICYLIIPGVGTSCRAYSQYSTYNIICTQNE